MYNTNYRPVFQRSNFQPAFGSHYMGQGQAPPPTTPPAPPPTTAPSKMNVPLVLGVSAGSGALLGFLATILYQKLDKRFPKGASIRGYGAVGGLIGALAGVGTALILKD
jgi:hypothetical protein